MARFVCSGCLRLGLWPLDAELGARLAEEKDRAMHFAVLRTDFT